VKKEQINTETTHVGVYGLVFQESQLLLVKKTRGPYKGKLDLPGGKPNFGESILECLTREIREESGVILIKAHPFQNFSCVVSHEKDKIPYKIHHIGIIYLILESDNSNIENKVNEDVEGIVWADIVNYDKLQLSDMASIVIREVLG
jgi:8-oxo-dGTP diphosphatase